MDFLGITHVRGNIYRDNQTLLEFELVRKSQSSLMKLVRLILRGALKVGWANPNVADAFMDSWTTTWRKPFAKRATIYVGDSVPFENHRPIQAHELVHVSQFAGFGRNILGALRYLTSKGRFMVEAPAYAAGLAYGFEYHPALLARMLMRDYNINHLTVKEIERCLVSMAGEMRRTGG